VKLETATITAATARTENRGGWQVAIAAIGAVLFLASIIVTVIALATRG
jgi:ABC-type tungstate transport system substrate-binding protein